MAKKEAYYVVHADDVGKRPVSAHKYQPGVNCRAVATYIPGKGETMAVLRMGYADYLDVTRLPFKTALVTGTGKLVLTDPRKI
jgi:hypothetical protein